MAEIANMDFLVEGADWADGADRGDGTDGTEVAGMALWMNALFYFNCSGHKEFKNIAYNGLWKPYAVTRDGTDRIIPLRLLRLLEHLEC